MALLPLCSVKGAPGVTTAACALGAVWPRERPTPIVVECDPAGGDLAARFGLEVTPGVVSLTVALEREPDVAAAADRNPLLEHAQQLRGGLHVVVAPTSPEEMRLPLDRLAEDLSILAHAGCDVIADCGRLESWGARERTPIARLIQRAGLVVVVASAHPGGDSASPRLAAVAERAPRAGAGPALPAWTVSGRRGRSSPRHPGDRHPPVRSGGCRSVVGRWPGRSRPHPRAATRGARGS